VAAARAHAAHPSTNWAHTEQLGVLGLSDMLLWSLCIFHALKMLIPHARIYYMIYTFPPYPAIARAGFISKTTSHWICWDQLSQQIQLFSSPSGSRRLAQTFNDMLGPVIQFWHTEPDQWHRSRIWYQTRGIAMSQIHVAVPEYPPGSSVSS